MGVHFLPSLFAFHLLRFAFSRPSTSCPCGSNPSYSRHFCPCSCEIHRVGSDSTANFKDALGRQRSNWAKVGMCGSTKYFRPSISSKCSFDPIVFAECRMLQGRRFQKSRTAAIALVPLRFIFLPWYAAVHNHFFLLRNPTTFDFAKGNYSTGSKSS